ncbi:MAG TPA: DinB family protein [Acidimicrobiales bacterium]|nr:DinB family protein [Acidimicrobiales bacterium]
MDVAGVLTDAFDRVRDVVHAVAADLDLDDLGFRPDEESNSIAWLLWHIARVQDDHIAGAAGSAQVWTEAGWCDRFGLPFEPSAHGYGQTPAEAALVVADAALLRGYHDAVHQKTVEFLQGLDAESLDRVVDRSFDPPVTLGVRLVSILSDNLQHAGQAAYLGGLALRRAH